MWHVSDKSQPPSTSDERNHVKPHPILTHQKAPKLRFLSSVEFRHSSGKFRAPVPSKYIIIAVNTYVSIISANNV